FREGAVRRVEEIAGYVVEAVAELVAVIRGSVLTLVCRIDICTHGRTILPSEPFRTGSLVRKLRRALGAPRAGGFLIPDSRFWRSRRRPPHAPAADRRADTLRQALEVRSRRRQDDGGATVFARVDGALVDLGIERRPRERIARGLEPIVRPPDALVTFHGH